MTGIDTNVLIRYVVQDEPAQAKAATHFIENSLSVDVPGFIAGIVLCEFVWVLEAGYGYGRALISEALQRLLETDRFRIESPEIAWRALEGYRNGADFPDAFISLKNLASGCDHTVTFDRRAARLDKVQLLRSA